MKTCVYCFFVSLFLISCKSLDYNSTKYYNSSGYKNLYVVDTIKISNPIGIITNKGHTFVMSKAAFDSSNCDEESLLLNPDAFLLKHGFPIGFPPEMYVKYNCKSKCYGYYDSVKSTRKGVDMTFSYSKEPIFFLLIFIRGDFYNWIYTGIDGPPPIKMKNSRFLYYRIVRPFCLDKDEKKQEKSDTEFIIFANSSVRLTCAYETGRVLQSLEYLPTGAIFSRTDYDVQSRRLCGKEELAMHGFDMYDSQARLQYMRVPRFSTMDPLQL